MNNNNDFFLSTNLKFLRTMKNEKQIDLAKALGYNSPTTVGNWEIGVRIPDSEDLLKLAIHYNVSVDDLCRKDLRIKETPPNEFEILFDKYKSVLSDKDKQMITFIIEQRKKEIDEQEN